MLPICHHLHKFSPSRPPTVVISNVSPLVEGGRYPVKRLVGEPLVVEADIFKDGHDLIRASLWFRQIGSEEAWQEAVLREGENQRWQTTIELPLAGEWELHIVACPDVEQTWLRGYKLKVEAGVDVQLETEEGAILLESASLRAQEAGVDEVAMRLQRAANCMRKLTPQKVIELWGSAELALLLEAFVDASLETVSQPCMRVLVERKKAAFSAWYEFFPRNALADGETHASLKDCDAQLHHAAKMGFDTIYLPPIHPIGRKHRKGKNNTLEAEVEDVGSPWAIGAAEGGHDTILSELGTLEDFRQFVEKAKDLGLEIALDFALQCAPDHPWVQQHPDWFIVRPDGSIQYAENPPKKYQDIYPIHFSCSDWKKLWETLADVLLFWCKQGVRAFRVDNPHTKPVAFWEYAMFRVRQQYPETIFLSEAFTKPKMMEMLGKVGFSQSYSYFTWRTNKQELIDYVTELTSTNLAQVMRANFWPNTPDILPYELWNAPLEKFAIRAFLAAFLSSNWGMYQGYEWGENRPHPPKEEYADSEKYQLVKRDFSAAGIVEFIAKLNQIRRSYECCAQYRNIEFCPSDNGNVLAWCRWDQYGENKLVFVVNLDAVAAQQDSVDISVLGLAENEQVEMRDVLDGEVYTWTGGQRVFVHLEPSKRVGHVFAINYRK